MLTCSARLGLVIALLLAAQGARGGPVTLNDGAEQAEPAASAAAMVSPQEESSKPGSALSTRRAQPEPPSQSARRTTDTESSPTNKPGRGANDPASKRAKARPARDAEDSDMDLLIQELPEWLRPKKASDKPSEGVGYGLENDPAKNEPRAADTPRYSDPTRDSQYSNQQRYSQDTANYGRDNPVRAVLKMIRDVVWHPMTWLIVIVVLIFSVFASALRRRK
jgi:hypothetical protein